MGATDNRQEIVRKKKKHNEEMLQARFKACLLTARPYVTLKNSSLLRSSTDVKRRGSNV